jgi:hypothetical protein
MSEPIPKSIHQTVHNLLTVLAQLGDPKAIEALKNTNDLDIVEDSDDEESQILVMLSDGDYLITKNGASFIPRTDGPD